MGGEATGRRESCVENHTPRSFRRAGGDVSAQCILSYQIPVPNTGGFLCL